MSALKSRTVVEAVFRPDPGPKLFVFVLFRVRSCSGVTIECRAPSNCDFESIPILRTDETPPSARLRVPAPCSIPVEGAGTFSLLVVTLDESMALLWRLLKARIFEDETLPILTLSFLNAAI